MLSMIVHKNVIRWAVGSPKSNVHFFCDDLHYLMAHNHKNFILGVIFDPNMYFFVTI